MSLTSWFLVSSSGTRHRLPREMIFVGRDDCELMLQSRSVDKQHAVINYEAASDEHKVKDLGSLNGTFVNDVRIQEQIYITLKINDKLRFGYDTNLFTVMQGELHVPEEALKHKKFTSQLQLTKIATEGESVKVSPHTLRGNPAGEGSSKALAKPADTQEEKTSADVAMLHRGTPLYGQPSWWGDDEEENSKPGVSAPSRKQEAYEADAREQKKPKQDDMGQEPSYFEIPTKMSLMAECSLCQTATKEPESMVSAPVDAASMPCHASFTIEFDSSTPGKVTIKDQVNRHGPDHRARSRKAGLGDKELSTLQDTMVAVECKVADWLAQNDPLLARVESTEEDNQSIKSDVAVQVKRLKGSKHEDGTESDSENGLRCHGPGVGGEHTSEAPGSHGPGTTPLLSKSHAGNGGCPVSTPQPRPTIPFMGSKGVPSPLACSHRTSTVPIKQTSEDSSPARSSASMGQQTSPGEDAPEPSSTKSRQHDEDQSDKGTYTIELENHNPDEEEARRMIDKVFGIEGIPQHCTDQQTGKAKDWHTKLTGQVPSQDLISMGGPRWISQWASLAASHTRTDPEGSGEESSVFKDISESTVGTGTTTAVVQTSIQPEYRRRALPQRPSEDKSDEQQSKPNKGLTTLGLRCEIGEKQDTELQEKASHLNYKPSSRGPMAKDDDRIHISKEVLAQKDLDNRSSTSPKKLGGSKEKGQEDEQGKRLQDSVPTKSQEKKDEREKSGKPLVRQGSFTIDKPSSNVPIELIPHIKQKAVLDSVPEQNDSVSGFDNSAIVNECDMVRTLLQSKPSDERHDLIDPPSYPLEGSISPESDIDTASTVSQAAADGHHKVTQKRKTLSGLHRERSTISSAAKSTTKSSSHERQEKRSKARPSENRKEARRFVLPSSRPHQLSLDIANEEPNVLPSEKVSSSVHKTYSSNPHNRGQLTSSDELSHSKMDSAKTGRSKSLQCPVPATGKPTTLPRPRPTRASLLRRARLGETSDTDLADIDKMSVASEVSTTSSTSKAPLGRKGASRTDLLAQPRRMRLGSLSVRSDSEATVARGSHMSQTGGETALRLGFRGTFSTETKAAPRLRASSVSKMPDSKSKAVSSVHSSPSGHTRWRRFPPDYASTSEDEFGSNRHPSKYSHPLSGTATWATKLGGSAPTTPSPGRVALKHRMREQDEYMRDWTAHSEEIARISQDLAKDLAMLAREIHDVAGEIDSVSSSGAVPSTTLVDRMLDESLRFRKALPVVESKAPEANGESVELRPRTQGGHDSRAAIRRRTWNRDEEVLDSLMLTSVSQLSVRIRQSVDKTAGKIRVLFKDKDRNWDEIESKLRAESDLPLLKTSNQELSTILQELKRVEKQLQVINSMVDPEGTLDALANLGLTSPGVPELRSSPATQDPLPVNGTGRASLGSAHPQRAERGVSHCPNHFNAGGDESYVNP